MKFKEYFKEMMVKRFDLDSRNETDNTPMVYEDDTKYHGKVPEKYVEKKKLDLVKANRSQT